VLGATEKLFLCGFGAAASLYRPGLPGGWTAVDLPGARCGGSFESRRRWLVGELDRRRGPVVLAGHSMGGALAIAAAAARPELVAGLLLISPAGLPLAKPMARSLLEFAGQAARGRYPAGESLRSVAAALRSPARALRLARSVHASDLSAEMAAVRSARIEATVVGCATDTLVTTGHCRRAADLLGATYRELSLPGGHMWMLDGWPALAGVLDAA
jgi:pimeloyl-ACP methyl ester carboxylesterase